MAEHRSTVSRVRVAIVADTHGFLDTRIAAEVATCDIAVHAGDVGAHAVLVALRDHAGEVIAVRGNNDTPQKWPTDEYDIMRELPEVDYLELPGGLLVTVHGDRYPARNRHAKLRREFPEARAVVYGHSHRLAIDKHARPWLLNPGAAGRSRTYGGPSCLILNASARAWRVTERRCAPLKRRSRGRGPVC